MTHPEKKTRKKLSPAKFHAPDIRLVRMFDSSYPMMDIIRGQQLFVCKADAHIRHSHIQCYCTW